MEDGISDIPTEGVMGSAGGKPRHPPQYDADIARLRAYMVYKDLSIRGLAQAAGVARNAVELINHPDYFRPRVSTLRKLVAIVPLDFSEEGAAAERQASCGRVRAWLKESGLKRYQLKPLGVPYEWVKDIDSDDWSPSWFVLRKLLALIPPTPPGKPAPIKGQRHGTRTTAKTPP